FPWAVFNPDSPPGTRGAFDRTGSGYGLTADEIIPIDTSKRYRFSYRIKQRNPDLTNTRHYGLLMPMDAQRRSIQPEHYMYTRGSTTTIAGALKKGDTEVHLTNSAYWHNGATGHRRRITFWNWVDEDGKVWGPETYSRQGSGADIYPQGGINTSTHVI